jgi:dTDP-4-amino-4,6-dideoxygalactose transaminase
MSKRTRAVCVVHIGGHIAFEIEEIARFCSENGIFLLEDCAHAHGAKFNGKAAGFWGIGGAYSFYATKTMPLGEGGMLCTSSHQLAQWAGYFRNYGKHVDNGQVFYRMTNGFNFRMNEVTAALGIVQLERLPTILAWKRTLAAKFDQLFDRRIQLPAEMISGYYKYIVFDYPLKMETGKVFNRTDFGPEIEGIPYDLPNSRWIADHHRCPPIWYGWPHAEKTVEDIAELLIESRCV